MAKSKKTNRLKMKGYPTHRFLRYKLAHTAGADDNTDKHYIDLARDLSSINRRMYRQGMVYGVSNFTFHDRDSALEITVNGLRHSWPTYSAYRLARRVWNKQVRASQEKPGAWQQFIVALNRDVLTDADCLLPQDNEGFQVERGEWLVSQLSYYLGGSDRDEKNAALVMTGESNDTAVTMPSTIGGATATTGSMFAKNSGQGTTTSLGVPPQYSGSLSIMDQWARLKADIPETPEDDGTPVQTNVFAGLLQINEGGYPGTVGYIDEITGRVQSEGDHPPYPQNVAGLDDSGTNDALWHYRGAKFGTGQKTIMSPGMEVPLGLLMLETYGTSNGTMYVDIELEPGSYKGVRALEV